MGLKEAEDLWKERHTTCEQVAWEIWYYVSIQRVHILCNCGVLVLRDEDDKVRKKGKNFGIKNGEEGADIGLRRLPEGVGGGCRPVPSLPAENLTSSSINSLRNSCSSCYNMQSKNQSGKCDYHHNSFSIPHSRCKTLYNVRLRIRNWRKNVP